MSAGLIVKIGYKTPPFARMPVSTYLLGVRFQGLQDYTRVIGVRGRRVRLRGGGGSVGGGRFRLVRRGDGVRRGRIGLRRGRLGVQLGGVGIARRRIGRLGSGTGVGDLRKHVLVSRLDGSEAHLHAGLYAVYDLATDRVQTGKAVSQREFRYFLLLFRHICSSLCNTPRPP